jgi:SAM-dependent methyltransferase
MADGSWRRLLGARGIRGEDYEAHFESLAVAGQDVHGEASFVEALGVRCVLDAGCGTGRVARELARRGLEVVGVDADPAMIEMARQRAPQLDWHLDDLASIQLGRAFDAAVMAGNVILFVARGTEGAVVTNVARHLVPGGLLVAGFQLFPGRLSLERYDALAQAAGLVLHQRWGTWGREPWTSKADYAVSVHQTRS